MTKILEIDTCWQCKNVRLNSIWYCSLTKHELNGKSRKIPDTCPLPDKEEKK